MMKSNSNRLFNRPGGHFKTALSMTLPENIIPPDTNQIEIYDVHNIDFLVWPATPEGTYAKNLLMPLIKNGVNSYIDNIHTEIKLIKLQETIIPVTINDAEYENSYVCSPYGYYISYAQDSLDVIKLKLLRSLVKGTLGILSKVFKFLKMNKVVIVNNWLCSTNLFPNLPSNHISIITGFLKNLYPQHAIIFRSIDPKTNFELFSTLKKSSFKLIASRQIYFTDTTHENTFESRIFKSDIKLLQASEYEIIDSSQISHAEIDRILDLYSEIYINRHSKLNPKLNDRYIKLALDYKILHVLALKKNGKIDGVVGYFVRNGMMTCSLFGYDKTVPSEVALYRQLSTILMLEAKKRSLIFHQSAGASTYKKIRKAQDSIEYTAVYDKHLTLNRKVPWFLIKGLFNSLGVYFMKKY